ncbi:MAG: hypothetical protein ACYTEK_13485, partial [Planctomycetota bacterium]
RCLTKRPYHSGAKGLQPPSVQLSFLEAPLILRKMVIESSAQFSSFHNSLIVKHLWNVDFCGIGR